MSVNAINISFYSDTKISTLPGVKSFPCSHFFQLSGFCIHSTSMPPDSSQLVDEKWGCFTSLCWILAELSAMRRDSTRVIICVSEALWLWMMLPPSCPRMSPGLFEAAALTLEVAPWAAMLTRCYLLPLSLYSSQHFFFAEWEGYCRLSKNHCWTKEQTLVWLAFLACESREWLHAYIYSFRSAWYTILLFSQQSIFILANE